MEAQTSPLLTVREAAERLHVSEKTIYRLAARRALPAVRVGRVLRFGTRQLEEWMREQNGANR